jgi:putative chitinase
MKITPTQLQLVFPGAPPDRLQQAADEIGALLAPAELDTPLRLAHFLAQVRQEAGASLSPASENLNYSAQALIDTFAYYRQHPDEAVRDARGVDASGAPRAANQQAIACKAYGMKFGNGDLASGDGWRYRGRGFIQITFRDNYKAVSTQCVQLRPGLPFDFVGDPDAVGVMPGALLSAIGFWAMHGLGRVADLGAADAVVDRVTAVVNLHTASYPQRREGFQLCMRALS